LGKGELGIASTRGGDGRVACPSVVGRNDAETGRCEGAKDMAELVAGVLFDERCQRYRCRLVK
jgi:hypothetical protein